DNMILTGTFLFYMNASTNVDVNIQKAVTDSEMFNFISGFHSIVIDSIVINSGRLARFIPTANGDISVNSITTTGNAIISYNSELVSTFSFDKLDHSVENDGILFNIFGSGIFNINGKYMRTISDSVIQISGLIDSVINIDSIDV